MACVFILSTGRTGTVTLTSLLSLSEELLPLHEPCPLLFEEAIAFYEGKGPEIAPLIEDTRRPLIEQAADRLYVETACYFHFLPKTILKAFPSAKFVHLHRDPYEHIRSGMRRRWYREGLLRVEPKKEGLSAVEKIAWYWGFANGRIHDFLISRPKDSTLNLSFLDLIGGRVERLYEFLGAQAPTEQEVQRILSKQLNAQKEGTFEWNSGLKARVKPYLLNTAEKLGYDL